MNIVRYAAALALRSMGLGRCAELMVSSPRRALRECPEARRALEVAKRDPVGLAESLSGHAPPTGWRVVRETPSVIIVPGGAAPALAFYANLWGRVWLVECTVGDCTPVGRLRGEELVEKTQGAKALATRPGYVYVLSDR